MNLNEKTTMYSDTYVQKCTDFSNEFSSVNNWINYTQCNAPPLSCKGKYFILLRRVGFWYEPNFFYGKRVESARKIYASG